MKTTTTTTTREYDTEGRLVKETISTVEYEQVYQSNYPYPTPWTTSTTSGNVVSIKTNKPEDPPASAMIC
jgi:hypothetical protein